MNDNENVFGLDIGCKNLVMFLCYHWHVCHFYRTITILINTMKLTFTLWRF